MEHYILDEFRVKNYRSFCDEQTLFLSDKRSVTAIYGANASGKSNLFHALKFFCNFIQHSIDPDITSIPYRPFLLREKNNQIPSDFSVTFHNSDKKYKYSFSITADRVTKEILYDLSSSRARVVFDRNKGPSEVFTKNGFKKNLFVGSDSARDNSLLITLAQRTKNPYANAVFDLINNLTAFSLIDVRYMFNRSTQLLQEKPQLERQVIEYLHKADFSITDFSYNVSRITADMLSGAPFSEEMKNELMSTGKNISINTIHALRNDAGDKVGTVTFDMDRQESLGTRIFFNLIIFILNAIQTGKTLYIDEFGSSLHTKLCNFIITLFKAEGHKTNAQLIINTHDLGLLKTRTTGSLDKEDVVIIEKDRFEQSIITPLPQKMSRSDENFGKKLSLGVYGGVPIIEEME